MPESLADQILEVAKWLDEGGAVSFVTEPEEDRDSVTKLPASEPRTVAELLRQQAIEVSQIQSRDLTCPHCMRRKLERFARSRLGKQRWKCRVCDRTCSEGTALV